jgi:two-component system, LuxR family, response regulator FixJ
MKSPEKSVGRILVADDEDGVRTFLAESLERAGHEVTQVADGAAALRAAHEEPFDVVLTDLRMPGTDGMTVVRTVRTEQPDVEVVVLTAFGDVATAVEAMKLGAFDFFEKPFEDEVLIARIKSAVEQVASTTNVDRQAQEIAGRVESLTPRERQVLEGLVAGQPNKVIGRELEISPRTVEIYRANVMMKMKASSVSELVRLAILAGTR